MLWWRRRGSEEDDFVIHIFDGLSGWELREKREARFEKTSIGNVRDDQGMDKDFIDRNADEKQFLEMKSMNCGNSLEGGGEWIEEASVMLRLWA